MITNSNQSIDFSHILGKAIAAACDQRFSKQSGLPLGDLDIAIEEGKFCYPKSKLLRAKVPTHSQERTTLKGGAKNLHTKLLKILMEED